MGLSIWQILIVVLLLVLLFGRGKISELMGDMAKGIKSFKKGMAEDDDDAEPAVSPTTETRVADQRTTPIDTSRAEDAETVEERKRDSA